MSRNVAIWFYILWWYQNTVIAHWKCHFLNNITIIKLQHNVNNHWQHHSKVKILKINANLLLLKKKENIKHVKRSTKMYIKNNQMSTLKKTWTLKLIDWLVLNSNFSSISAISWHLYNMRLCWVRNKRKKYHCILLC